MGGRTVLGLVRHVHDVALLQLVRVLHLRVGVDEVLLVDVVVRRDRVQTLPLVRHVRTVVFGSIAGGAARLETTNTDRP